MQAFARRSLSLVLLPALAACASTRGAGADRPESPSAAPSPSTAAGRRAAARAEPGPAWKVPTPTGCDVHRASQLVALRTALERVSARDPEFSPISWLSSMCVADAKGAWALSFESIADAEPSMMMPGYQGTLRLVRVDEHGKMASGKKVSGAWPWVAVAYDEPFARDLRRLGSPFDYDGDGVPEFSMPDEMDELHDMVRLGSEVTVWTAKGGAMARYAPTSKIDHIRMVRDVDGDGRPDLLYAGPYFEPRGEPFLTNLEPLLVAHSLAGGGFSIDDAAATAAIKEACPANDLSFEADVASGVRCARLWGRSKAETRQAAAVVCKERTGSSCGKTVDDWIDREPPLTLK